MLSRVELFYCAVSIVFLSLWHETAASGIQLASSQTDSCLLEGTAAPLASSLLARRQTKMKTNRLTTQKFQDAEADSEAIQERQAAEGYARYSKALNGRFWYVHIPVCAGRSIEAGLQMAMQEGNEREVRHWGIAREATLTQYNFVWGGHSSWSKSFTFNKELEGKHEDPYQAVFIMRHPYARTESWVYNQYDVGPRDVFLRRHENGNNATGELDTPNEVMNLQNMIVWMLGDQVEPHLRTVTVDEALVRAKEVVRKAAFVGFVEDLPHSFLDMLAKVGLPDDKGLPHIKTRRDLPPEKTDTMLRILHEWNKHDLALYTFARSIWAPPKRQNNTQNKTHT